MTRPAGRLLAVVVVAAALVAAPLAAVPAYATTVTMTFSAAKASVRYGGNWNSELDLDGLSCGSTVCTSTVQISYSGPRRGTTTTTTYGNASSSTSRAYVGDGLFDSPLPVGTYRFSATYSSDWYSGATTTDFVLTVTPAPVGTDLRVALDDQNPRNAVITAFLTGDYISSIGGEAGGPPLPAGTWHVIAADAKGRTVLDQQVQRDAGSDPSVNVYWTGVTTQAYSVSASFSPAAAAGDFAMSNATGTRFTPSAAVRPNASPSPSATLTASAFVSAPSVPLWAVALVGLLVVLLALALILVSVRLTRGTSATAPSDEEAADVPA